MVERMGKKKQDKLIRAIEYIKMHFTESPPLQETAEHIHVSSSYLSKIFIGCLHTPYSVFVLNGLPGHRRCNSEKHIQQRDAR